MASDDPLVDCTVYYNLYDPRSIFFKQQHVPIEHIVNMKMRIDIYTSKEERAGPWQTLDIIAGKEPPTDWFMELVDERNASIKKKIAHIDAASKELDREKRMFFKDKKFE